MLTELAVGVPNALSGDNVFGTVCASLASTLIATDGNTNVGAGANTQDAAGTSEVRVAALFFARVAAETANPTETSPHLSVIASPLVHAMSDRYYKTAAEAVRAIEALVPAFVSACEQDADNTYAQIVTALAATLTLLLSELDRDVEVKTASLACAGAVCASLGKFSQEKEIQSLMEGLCDKLGNETSRVQAAKALASVFASAGANESAVALVAPKSAQGGGFHGDPVPAVGATERPARAHRGGRRGPHRSGAARRAWPRAELQGRQSGQRRAGGGGGGAERGERGFAKKRILAARRGGGAGTHAHRGARAVRQCPVAQRGRFSTVPAPRVAFVFR